LLPPEVVVVSESGINSAGEVQWLRKAGIDAVLVGTVLVTSADPEAKLRELAGRRQA
jgi:indole-3-glycerol phosphate synthase